MAIWRDPLDELITDLEHSLPTSAPAPEFEMPPPMADLRSARRSFRRATMRCAVSGDASRMASTTVSWNSLTTRRSTSVREIASCSPKLLPHLAGKFQDDIRQRGAITTSRRDSATAHRSS